MEYVVERNPHHQKMKGIDFGKIVDFPDQILATLVFLNDQGVIHRDVNLANILCVIPDLFVRSYLHLRRNINSS